MLNVQQTLDTPIPCPRARATDPETSHAAAASVQDITATHARILALFHEHGDMCDQDLHTCWQAMTDAGDYPPISPSGLRSRRSELVTLGRVVDTGWKVKLRTGRQATVWGVERQVLLEQAGIAP